MTPLEVLVLLGVVVVVTPFGLAIGFTVGWFATRRTIASMYGSAPWNWRILIGHDRYTDWLCRR